MIRRVPKRQAKISEWLQMLQVYIIESEGLAATDEWGNSYINFMKADEARNRIKQLSEYLKQAISIIKISMALIKQGMKPNRDRKKIRRLVLQLSEIQEKLRI